MKGKLIVYIDGASQGNPGPAGIGIVLQDHEKKTIKSMYKYIGEATNNVAEYTALIYSLQEALIQGFRDVVINSDSELLVKQLNGQYKVKDSNLRMLYEQFLHIRNGFDKLEVIAIKREENESADSLANEAIETRINTNIRCK